MADSPEIVAYLKPVCGWSNGVREVFRKYGLQYADKDIINNPEIYAEMVQKSGQPLSPCVVVDGEMIFSKHDTHRFPESDEIIGALRARG